MSLCDPPWGADLPFTPLDLAFAQFLQEREPAGDSRHAWLAALASHQLGRGHACLDLGQLAADAAGLLAWDDAASAQIPRDLADAAPRLAWAQGASSPLVLVEDGAVRRLYLRRAWSAEQRILEQLSARLARRCPPPFRLAEQLDALFTSPVPAGLPDWQRVACEVAASHYFTVITGGPGTGKTTTVTRLLALLASDARARGSVLRAHLAAPTGKAASRLSQSIGKRLRELPLALQEGVPTQATTLHQLLNLRGTSRAAPTPQLATDLVIVDEASMVDLEMMARLLDAVPRNARLVLLGDKDQLASVEAGAVLAQLCERPQLAAQIVTLQYSHRFANDSGIGRWAQVVNAGDASQAAALWQQLPRWSSLGEAPMQRLAPARLPDAQFTAAVRAGWSAWREQLADLVARREACSDAEAIELLEAFAAFQVLGALRQGPWGTEQLNGLIARSLGFGRERWYAGRPVMVTHNDYTLKLMNGDVGLTLPREGGALRVAFLDAEGALRWVLPSRLEGVETVFAMTVHKSQGSEYGEVLLVLPDQASPVLTRELLYTGITRAMRRLTLLVPERKVLLEAVRRRVRRSGGLVDGPLGRSAQGPLTG